MAQLQLNPTLPVWHPTHGEGHAVLMVDYSQEHEMMFTVFFNSGEIWTLPTKTLRAQWNHTLERRPKKSSLERRPKKSSKDFPRGTQLYGGPFGITDKNPDLYEWDFKNPDEEPVLKERKNDQ